MSRNIDKANTVLFRLQEQRAEANGYIDYHSTQRPRNVNKVKSLNEAENWRKVIIKEINEKILRINSEINLSEYQIRDLNEEINKLCKEKYTYEYHILHNLNGSNYINGGGNINKYIESNSVKLKGYRYFGRAKELSDVKELIERNNEIKAKNLQDLSNQKFYLNKIKELEKRVNVEYFGYIDDLETFEDRKSNIRIENKEILEDLIDSDNEEEDYEGEGKSNSLAKAERRATRHRIKKIRQDWDNDHSLENSILIDSVKPVDIDEVQKFLVAKRKEELESKYSI